MPRAVSSLPLVLAGLVLATVAPAEYPDWQSVADVGVIEVVTHDADGDLRETKAFQLSQKDVYLINPGSVGQPRDKCPLSSFAIFDSSSWTVTFVRKQYDIPGAKKAIVDAGLPEKFARRLEVGV